MYTNKLTSDMSIQIVSMLEKEKQYAWTAYKDLQFSFDILRWVKIFLSWIFQGMGGSLVGFFPHFGPLHQIFSFFSEEFGKPKDQTKTAETTLLKYVFLLSKVRILFYFRKVKNANLEFLVKLFHKAEIVGLFSFQQSPS